MKLERRTALLGAATAALALQACSTTPKAGSPVKPRHYVLVHGAWHGAWAFARSAGAERLSRRRCLGRDGVQSSHADPRGARRSGQCRVAGGRMARAVPGVSRARRERLCQGPDDLCPADLCAGHHRAVRRDEGRALRDRRHFARRADDHDPRDDRAATAGCWDR